METIVADMAKANDFALKGYERFTSGWYVGPGHTNMGNNPSFSNNPSWSIYHRNPSYRDKVAKAVLPWIVVFDGTRHAASNAAVEVSNLRAYLKSRATGRWMPLGGPAGATGSYYGKPATGLPELAEVILRRSPTSAVIRIPDNRNYFWHGWWGAGQVEIDPDDILALFVTLQARLVVADPERPDDRAKAQLGLQVGADYYLRKGTVYREDYAPAVGLSRTKKITGDWQAFNFMTLADVGAQEPGGGIAEAELRAAPPPLE